MHLMTHSSRATYLYLQHVWMNLCAYCMLYCLLFSVRLTPYHFRVGAIVEFHGFFLHISNCGICTQRQGDEENSCMPHKHTHIHSNYTKSRSTNRYLRTRPTRNTLNFSISLLINHLLYTKSLWRLLLENSIWDKMRRWTKPWERNKTSADVSMSWILSNVQYWESSVLLT